MPQCGMTARAIPFEVACDRAVGTESTSGRVLVGSTTVKSWTISHRVEVVEATTLGPFQFVHQI